MKTSPRMMIGLTSLLLGIYAGLSAVAGEPVESPPLVRALAAKLPTGWTCTVHPGGEVARIPHGLGKPVSQIVVANPDISFPRAQLTPVDPKSGSPIIPLYLYPQADKAQVMQVIDKEKDYSWDIPIYFGETGDFVVVTSPAYVNGGCFGPEAKQAVRPAWKVLRELIPKKEKTGVDELAGEEPKR